MTMLIVRSEPPHRTPIVWKSWPEWRFGKRAPEHVEFRDPEENKPTADFCITCSGRGRLFIDTYEGMVPSNDCPTCKGTGSA